MIPYQDHVLKLIPQFKDITFTYIPWEEHKMQNALATLASLYKEN